MIHLGGAVANKMMMATHVEMIAKITVEAISIRIYGTFYEIMTLVDLCL